jgi:O-antigen/teichoic acid export membrane protein
LEGYGLRAKKALLNTIYGFVYEAVNIACTFVLPRLILTSFGSEYNGAMNAITQFLSVIALFQAGISGVTTAALYKPLAEKNHHEIDVIIKTTELFLRKVCAIYVVFAFIISYAYPYFVDFDRTFTVFLVQIMSFSTFSQYFFGQTYIFLLNADQRQGYVSAANSAKILLSTLIAVILIKKGYGLLSVKLGSSIVFLITPIFINIYAKKKYMINTNVKPDNSKLKQRWDNFGQQIANFLCSNTDLVILSIMSSVYEVSVYTIYNLVMKGVYGIFQPLVNSVGAAFGDMFAKNQTKLIQKNLRIYELFVFSSSTFLFGVVAASVVPFVKIYTKGVTDVNYEREIFAYIFVATMLFKCYRFPYDSIRSAIGHFRQTRNAAYIEAAINVVLSVALVYKLGIIGAILGTLVAFIYRTIVYAMYISSNIIKRSITIVYKRIFLSLAVTTAIAFAPVFVQLPIANDFFQWSINSAIISMIAMFLVLSTEMIFFRDDLVNASKLIMHSIRKC